MSGLRVAALRSNLNVLLISSSWVSVKLFASILNASSRFEAQSGVKLNVESPYGLSGNLPCARFALNVVSLKLILLPREILKFRYPKMFAAVILML